MRGTKALTIVTALLVASGCAAAPATTTQSMTPVAAVPPVPVVERIRYAAHGGYDRIVFDIPGDLPGYQTRYVTEVRQDPSDRPVPVPGKAFLLIVLHPAQARPTITGVHRTGLPIIQAWAQAGNFEGYVTIALGLPGKRKYQVKTLSDRIYVDVFA